MNKKELIKIFNAVSDSTRLDLVIFILKNNGCPCSKVLNKFKLSQPTMSHHLGKLIDADLIIKKKTGISNNYFINELVLQNSGLAQALQVNL